MSDLSQVDSTESQDEENTDSSRETSILFGLFANLLLVVSLFIAIWFKFLPMIAVASLLLILSLMIITWKKNSLKKLSLSLTIPSSRIFSGDEFKVHASIKNDKWLPLVWLEWEFPQKHLVGWGDFQDRTYVVRLLWLLSFQQTKWTIVGKGLQRGVYPIGQVILRSGDGFRFSEQEKTHDLNKEIYIYPELISVTLPDIRTSIQWEVKGRNGGFLEDPLLINGVREYQPGDEWRKLNWRASARTGKLQTNVYQPIVSEQLVAFVDVQGFVIDQEKYGEDPNKQKKYRTDKQNKFELLLSVVASFVVAFNEKGVHVGFASNAQDDVGKKQLKFISPQQAVTSILDQIAKISQQVIQQNGSSLNEIASNRRSVSVYIFCHHITEAHVLWYEQNKQKHDITFYYVEQNKHAVKLMRVAQPIDSLRGDWAVNES